MAVQQEATRPKSGYGWKLATFFLPTDTYQFEKISQKDAPDEMVELELKITVGTDTGVTYAGHRLRVFLPKSEWNYANRFKARLSGEHGIIVPDTVQPL